MSGIGFVAVALAVILFSLVSDRLNDSALTAPMVFAGFGLMIGDSGLSLVDFDVSHGAVHILAEVTLIMVLFSDAARIDLSHVRRDHELTMLINWKRDAKTGD